MANIAVLAKKAQKYAGWVAALIAAIIAFLAVNPAPFGGGADQDSTQTEVAQ